MALVGEGAKKVVAANYADLFARLAEVGNAFTLAEQVSSGTNPLLNRGSNFIQKEPEQGVKIYGISDVALSPSHLLHLVVGNPGTGFFQVPLIQAATGIDARVSGTIDAKGEAKKFPTPRMLTELVREDYGVAVTPCTNRVFAVALVPRSEDLGDQLYVAGQGLSSFGNSYYAMGVNGYMLERRIVSVNGNRLVPVMFPDKSGKERLLKISDVLSDGEVRKLEADGVYPGLLFLAGGFQEERQFDLSYLSKGDGLSLGGSGMMRGGPTLGGGSKGGGATRGGAGRVGLEVGDESQVRYGTTRGKSTGIDGIMAVYFLAVDGKTKPEEVQAAMAKLV
ncbi:TPA: hypothetical protein HA246_03185 [Candidatus Woesearchaeota archaeon]|nr:hypothetical protein [Candidatus Woesearchaeota archaeon]